MVREPWHASATPAQGGNQTNPPLNAPTGFRGGKGAASVSRRDDVWKLRATQSVVDGDETARVAAEDRRREAIL